MYLSVVRLLTLRSKSGISQHNLQCLLSKIRMDTRDLDLLVQDLIMIHLGTLPLVLAIFQVRLWIVTLTESSSQRKADPGTIHTEIILEMELMV